MVSYLFPSNSWFSNLSIRILTQSMDCQTTDRYITIIIKSTFQVEISEMSTLYMAVWNTIFFYRRCTWKMLVIELYIVQTEFSFIKSTVSKHYLYGWECKFPLSDTLFVRKPKHNLCLLSVGELTQKKLYALFSKKKNAFFFNWTKPTQFTRN